jgi:hypothetical protein
MSAAHPRRRWRSTTTPGPAGRAADATWQLPARGETLGNDRSGPASLDTEFDVEPLTEDAAARFTATIVDGGKTLPNRPIIDVAFANDASLKPSRGKFEITPLTDTRQYLIKVPSAEAGDSSWPGGGRWCRDRAVRCRCC